MDKLTVSWLTVLIGVGIMVIAHGEVALEGILDYALFLGVPSLLAMTLIITIQSLRRCIIKHTRTPSTK